MDKSIYPNSVGWTTNDSTANCMELPQDPRTVVEPQSQSLPPQTGMLKAGYILCYLMACDAISSCVFLVIRIESLLRFSYSYHVHAQGHKADRFI